MSHAARFLLTLALIGVGAAITFNHPEWGKLRGVAFVLLLLAAIVAAGLLSYRSRSEKTASRQKLPKSLVSLSSVTVLAVYAAGYHRTSSAEDKFTAQRARRRTALPVSAGAVKLQDLAARKTDVVGEPTPPPALVPTINQFAVDRPKPAAVVVPNAAPVVAATEKAPAPPQESLQKETPATPAAPTPPSPATPATPSPVAPPAAPAPAARQGKYKDGTYTGWGSSRHGDIQAVVLIQNGVIAAADVAQCLTRYSCSWIADLPGIVVSKQTADVDYVSGATESSYAFSDAVSDALLKANE